MNHPINHWKAISLSLWISKFPTKFHTRKINAEPNNKYVNLTIYWFRAPLLKSNYTSTHPLGHNRACNGVTVLLLNSNPFSLWLHIDILSALVIALSSNNYTGCNRRNGPDFRRVFLMLNYTEKPQNTYMKSWTVSEIMASEVWNFDSCYTLTDYQIHIETGRNMWFL